MLSTAQAEEEGSGSTPGGEYEGIVGTQAIARPWLRPAFDETKDKAVRVFGGKIGELAKK